MDWMPSVTDIAFPSSGRGQEQVAVTFGVWWDFFLVCIWPPSCCDLIVFLKKKKKIYLFLAALGLCCCTHGSLVAASRVTLWLQCTDFWLQWLLPLQSMGSRLPGFSSCGARSFIAHGICWNLLGPEIEPMSTALGGELCPLDHQESPSFLLCSHGEKENSLVHLSLFTRIPILSNLGSLLLTSFSLYYLPKGPIFKYYHIGD